MNDLTRRTLLNTFAGVAALAALGDKMPESAQGRCAKLPSMHDILTGPGFVEFRRFLTLSSVLTGVEAEKLTAAAAETTDGASGEKMSAGADPTLAHKLTYFELARSSPPYPSLLGIFESGLNSDVAGSSAKLNELAKQLLSLPHGQGDLARSIIMAWYFGVWYEWRIAPKPRFTVVSADAYTQGWAWRIAEAHPPGWSNFRFGYWAFEPPAACKPDAFVLKAVVA